MAEPFTGEVRMFAFELVPEGWARCDGQILPISQNQALYSLYGKTFGGDGMRTFALPDLRGRVAIHPDRELPQGSSGGEAEHVLNAYEMPAHTHRLRAANAPPSTNDPSRGVLAGAPIWIAAKHGNVEALASGTVVPAGMHKPHANMQPYLTVSFCVSLVGHYPRR
ncbi:MAG: phage tail protein [Acidobacteria bacterium]|nr:phage tail protein [Acidobacteriota bacterium]MBV9476744.1 phage tail protein [Acidobacteriota bacterium]